MLSHRTRDKPKIVAWKTMSKEKKIQQWNIVDILFVIYECAHWVDEWKTVETNNEIFCCIFCLQVHSRVGQDDAKEIKKCNEMFLLKVPHHHQPTHQPSYVIHHQWIHILICFYFYVDRFESSSCLNIQHGSSLAALFYYIYLLHENGNFLLRNSRFFAFLLSFFVVSIHFYFSNQPFQRLHEFFVHKPIAYTCYFLFIFIVPSSGYHRKVRMRKKKWIKLKIFELALVESSGWIFTVFRFLNTNILNIEHWTMSFGLSLLLEASTHSTFFLFFLFARNFSILLPVHSERQKKRIIPLHNNHCVSSSILAIQ